MKTIKLLSAASVAMLALGCASATLGSSSAAAQGYGAAPPPPPPQDYAPPPADYTPPPPSDYTPTPSDYAPNYPNRSLLKVCKIAVGFTPGDYYFTFYTKPGGQKQSVTVPAGPEPNGYCQVVGEYATGSEVVLHEYLPPGYTIASIRSMPANAQLSQNLFEGWVSLRLPRGVTEVYVRQIRTGWIEICKVGGRPGQMYTFSFIGTKGPMTVTTPAGSCTPAYEVPEGRLVVTEANAQGQMIGGETWPAGNFVSADPSQGQIVANISWGTIQTQTVVTFKNKPQGKGGY
jgi:hypothetical protein